jgi:hypothetical protein
MDNLIELFARSEMALIGIIPIIPILIIVVVFGIGVAVGMALNKEGNNKNGQDTIDTPSIIRADELPQKPEPLNQLSVINRYDITFVPPNDNGKEIRFGCKVKICTDNNWEPERNILETDMDTFFESFRQDISEWLQKQKDKDKAEVRLQKEPYPGDSFLQRIQLITREEANKHKTSIRFAFISTSNIFFDD